MTDGPPTIEPALNPADVEQAFEDAWATGTPPRIEDFLAAAPPGDPRRRALLEHLVAADQEHRWKRAGPRRHRASAPKRRSSAGSSTRTSSNWWTWASTRAGNTWPWSTSPAAAWPTGPRVRCLRGPLPSWWRPWPGRWITPTRKAWCIAT